MVWFDRARIDRCWLAMAAPASSDDAESQGSRILSIIAYFVIQTRRSGRPAYEHEKSRETHPAFFLLIDPQGTYPGDPHMRLTCAQVGTGET